MTVTMFDRCVFWQTWSEVGAITAVEVGAITAVAVVTAMA